MKFRLKNPFSIKSTSQTVGLTDTFIPVELSRSLSYSFGQGTPIEYSNEGYAENPYFFAIADKIAQKVATLPRSFIDPENPEKPVRPVNEYLDLLNKPNSLMNREDFYYYVTANLLIQGESFIHGLQAIGFRGIQELLSPLSQNTTVNEVTGKILNYNYVLHGASYTGVKPDDMLHIYRHNIAYDSMRGLSPLKAGRKVYKADNELREAKASIFENRGASGVIYGKGQYALTPDEREELQKYYDSQVGGNNRDKRYISGTELGHIPLGMDGNMMKGVSDEGLANLRDACRILHYPSQLMNDPAASTYNNMKEAEKAAMLNAILPVAMKIDKSLSEFVIGEKLGVEDVYYIPDVSMIKELQSVSKEEAETMAIDIQNGILLPEEARAMRYPKLPPLPPNTQGNEPND